MNLFRFNPWWKKERVPQMLIGKRRYVYDEISKYFNLRQALIFHGLRRVGKTTLLFQIIDEFLRTKAIDPYHVLYYSFDDEESEIENIVGIYEKEILKRDLTRMKKVYFFFDEVQKLENWSEKVKVLYDLYPNVKLFLSGSAAINILKGTRESLAGRFFDFMIEPLDFDEFLDFKGVEIDRDREHIFEIEIKRYFDEFLKTGGFIETMEFDRNQLQKYFREGLLERVVYRDLPTAFSINSPDLLYQLMRICAETPGFYLDYKNIGNDLNYDWRTIANYVSYLEYALLVKKLYNYSPNFLTSEKKLKRIYPASTAFTITLSNEYHLSIIMEQFYSSCLKAKFFWKTPQKDEIDLILSRDKEVFPVEVKIRNEIKERDTKPIFKFLKKYKFRKGYIISRQTEKNILRAGFEVKIIPYWKYWTLQKELSLLRIRPPA